MSKIFLAELLECPRTNNSLPLVRFQRQEKIKRCVSYGFYSYIRFNSSTFRRKYFQRLYGMFLINHKYMNENSVSHQSLYFTDSFLFDFSQNGHLTMMDGYMDFFMEPSVLDIYLSLRKELDEVIQRKVRVKFYLTSNIYKHSQSLIFSFFSYIKTSRNPKFCDVSFCS